MANVFSPKNLSPRQSYERKYKTSRMNLLLLVVATAINLLLVGTGSDRYYLFSAYIPYLIMVTGMYMCGMLPPEYYDAPMEDYLFYDKSLFVALLILSIIITLLYLLAWFMSKKNRVGWLIFALVFFGLDTVGMLIVYGFAVDAIVNILFHAWVIYYLVVGIIAHNKLKNYPYEDEPVMAYENAVPQADGAEEVEAATAPVQNSNIIRRADTDVKHRVFLEKRMFNMDICYRRVKRVNELVINGYVYDELEALAEPPHTLEAYADGHHIEAGYDGVGSFLKVDGKEIAKKIRIF